MSNKIVIGLKAGKDVYAKCGLFLPYMIRPRTIR